MHRPPSLVFAGLALLSALIAGSVWLVGRHQAVPAPSERQLHAARPAVAVGVVATGGSLETPRPAPSIARVAVPQAMPSKMPYGELLAEIRSSVRDNPPRAEALARAARQRLTDAEETEESDALLVDALINEGRIGAARSETYYYYDHHPNGKSTAHLFAMTGVHPTAPTPGLQ